MTAREIVSRGQGVKQELEFFREPFTKGEKARKYTQERNWNKRSYLVAMAGKVIFQALIDQVKTFSPKK